LPVKAQEVFRWAVTDNLVDIERGATSDRFGSYAGIVIAA
jgi:hypothetical protein